MLITEELEQSIKEEARLYRGFVTTQTRLTNQRAALIRATAAQRFGADYLNVSNAEAAEAKAYVEDIGHPLYNSLAEMNELLKPERNKSKRALEKLAAQLPHYDWIKEEVTGFGAATYAQLIGETGDLTRYDNPAKLWKRMGLAVIKGERQRKVRDPELAKEMGYAPHRRSLMYVAGGNVLKRNGAEGTYRKVYDERRKVEIQKCEAIFEAKKAKNPKALYSVKSHSHNRAMRYMVKRILRDLWGLWND